MAQVLLVGAHPGATAAQIAEIRTQLEGELPDHRIVVVPGMTGGPIVVEARDRPVPFVEVCTPLASIW